MNKKSDAIKRYLVIFIIFSFTFSAEGKILQADNFARTFAGSILVFKGQIIEAKKSSLDGFFEYKIKALSADYFQLETPVETITICGMNGIPLDQKIFVSIQSDAVKDQGCNGGFIHSRFMTGVFIIPISGFNDDIVLLTGNEAPRLGCDIEMTPLWREGRGGEWLPSFYADLEFSAGLADLVNCINGYHPPAPAKF